MNLGRIKLNTSYSANDKLTTFAQNLGFELFIFDDLKNIGPQIKLIEKSKKGEIDAILLYKNIICLVGINKGRSTDVNREMKKFFDKLDKIDKVTDINLELAITSRNKETIKGKIKLATRLLGDVKKELEEICNEYEPMLIKLFFCPNMHLEEDIVRRGRRDKRIIIDKDIFEYFQEVLNRLDNRFLFRDFIHFLDIKKVDLEKKGTSRTRDPAKGKTFFVDKLDLELDKIIMYSLSLRVEDIIEYVTVLRMARTYDKRGFQRMVKSTRLTKINDEYLNKNETFPNNIIIALNPDIYLNEAAFYVQHGRKLSLLDEYNSLIIIDGQHRLLSFSKGRKLNKFILVTLIFFKGENEEQNHLLMDKMFYKINKTQERIDPNLSFILKARIDPASPEAFWYAVFKKLDRKGFFNKRFSFKEATVKREPQKSIISVITYGGVLRLNKTYKTKGIQVNGLEIFYTNQSEQDITFAFNLVKNYFDVIEKVLHKQTINKKNVSPREIGALLRLLKHFMVTDKNKLKKLGTTLDISKSRKKKDLNTIKSFETIMNCIPFKKTINLNYPASNWAAVEGYMLRKINNVKPSFGNRTLLSKKGQEVYKRYCR